MKRLFAVLFAVLMLAALVFPCLAAEYDDSIYRVNDFVGVLDDDELEMLEDKAYDSIEPCMFDFPVFIFEGEEDDDVTERTDSFYEYNDYGYGETKDGIILGLDLGNYTYDLITYGRGQEIFAGDAYDELMERTVDNLNDYDTWFESINAYLNDVTGTVYAYNQEHPADNAAAPEKTGTEAPEDTEPVVTIGTSDSGKTPSWDAPPWYPDDVQHFEDFHDADAPRVVDYAGIFTNSEKAAMLEKIEDIQEKYGTDLVVVTDDSSYGLSRFTYAADFHQFNGYGFGDDYNGTCLFVCMESGNRGFETVWTGDCSRFYTDRNTEILDDTLYEYMADGDYGEGVLNYLDNVDTMYQTGKAPKKAELGMPIAGGVVCGALGGLITVSSKKSKMKTVRTAERATEYIVPGSFHLTDSRDIYLYTSVTRVYNPPKERSGGGGGSSSGGRSYGGSGRSF